MRFTNRQILKITFPVMLSLMMEQLIGLTDTIYLGHVGEVELGASAIAGIFYLTIFMVGFGFSIGAQVLIARRNGEGNLAGIGPIFMQGMWFLLGMAVLFFGVSRALAPWLLGHLIESRAICAAAESYLGYRTFGFFFSFAAAMFRAFYVGTTNTRILTANSVVMVLTNVVLNYLLIFGGWGIPPLGIAGAAIASVISEAVSLVFFVVYTYRRVAWRAYGLFRFRGIEWKILRQVFGVSVWIMLQEAIAFISWFIFFVAIENLGERPLAVTNMVRSISSVVFLFINAFASTASSLVGNLIGAGEADRVWGLCRRMVRLCFAFVLPVSLLFALLPRVVLGAYTGNAELIAAAVPSLWVMVTDDRAVRAGLHLSVQRFGHGQYAHGARDYAGLRHGLYALYAVARLCRPGRRGALLDGRPRLLSDLAGALLCLYPQRAVAEVEDLNFARRSLLCALRNDDLLRFEFLSSHLAGLRPAESHCFRYFRRA